MTLEQLKLLPAGDLAKMWVMWEYPFDALPCGQCILQHHEDYGICNNHPEITAMLGGSRSVREVREGLGQLVRDNLDLIWGLRTGQLIEAAVCK
jgi:hypothetical protein